MPELTPLLRDQRQVDAGHLKLLAIFHYVLAGLSIVGLGFLLFHWFIMHAVFENPDLWKNQKGGPPPREFFLIFRWFYLVAGVFIIGSGICNLLSGLFIQRRRARVFSLIIAGLNCLAFPFGTLLGVFTLIVLLRQSVEEVYNQKPKAIPPPL